MIPRLLQDKLITAATQYPVVTLTGPRQSGKTTLVRSVFAEHQYISLEDPEQRKFALDDPRGFLGQVKGNVILDEVQRAPDLFSYIQVLVDAEDRPGRFILTGSQNFLLLAAIGQSLAGRCAILHLLPLSLGELMGWQELPLGQIGRSIAEDRDGAGLDLLSFLHAGFFPRIHDKHLEPQEWLRNYTQTYLERDVRDILNVGDLDAFRRFLGLCAGRAGQILNLSSLAADCGITHTTARRWLSVLEASFIVWILRPHHKNFNKRLVKSPKLYFLDSGLLCYLLRIRSAEELALHASRGAVFETYVVSELLKRTLHRGREPSIFFWRDSTGNEVDILIDAEGGVIPVEIKSGQTVAADFFKGLDYWKKVSKTQSESAGLIYGGNRSYHRKGTAVHAWWNF
jgi:hypothetical protein